ncbi:MAG: S1C family serine protease [Bacillota bacterium]|jgi:serine protease Do
MSYFSERRGRAGFIVLLVVCIFAAAIAGGLFAIYATNNFNLGDSDVAEEQASESPISYSSTSESDLTQVTAIANKVSPAIVSVTNISTVNDFYMGGTGTTEETQGTGSGVIISADGYIVTNYHVVAGSKKITVGMANGDIFDAAVIASDEYTDLAVLKIEAKDLSFVEFADSGKVAVGELAVAIGNPGGEDFARSVTAGIVSGLNRMLATSEGLQSSLIQTDAAINPGNSGGALVNGEGKLIGINSTKIASTEFEGMGFAIPSNTVKEITEQLIEKGKVVRPALGVSIVGSVTEQIAAYNNLPVAYGVVIMTMPGGGAVAAGMQDYDVIIALDEKEIADAYDLQQTIFSKEVNDKVSVKFLRQVQKGKFVEKTLTVTLGELE